ncbi:hypothetical protein PI124_g22784 [Phytophthora idaei]|nr:hypothetical protein PI124_g22784 [Phytophthora idaei]
MQTNVMTEAARCVAASGSTSTTPSAEANSVLQRDEEPIANRRQKKSRSGNHGRGNASGRGGNEAKRRRRERDTEGECHYSHQLGHYKVDCPMRKRHRIEPEGGSADIALGDSAMREFEDQHVTTVSVAEVWGLAVLLDDSGSKTNTDDLSSCSDTLSESIGDESEARSSERVMDSMVSEDGEIGRDISRAYWHLPLQPSVAADVAAFQQAEETQAALRLFTAYLLPSGLLESLNPCVGTVTVANNETAPVEGVGTVTIHVKDPENKVQQLVLSNVLFLPGLQKNLISATQLVMKGVTFDFHSPPGKVVLERGQMRLVSESQQGMCVLKTLNKAQLALYAFPQLTIDLAHRRFGHASNPVLEAMLTKKMVTGMPSRWRLVANQIQPGSDSTHIQRLSQSLRFVLKHQRQQR